MSPKDCLPSVPGFYAGKSVFITGATGFLGKVLIEKLLYSCQGIDKIYIMVRNDGKNDGKQKVEKLIKSQAFSRLKAERPQDLTKIIAVAGDLSLPNLGIKTVDDETLIKQFQKKIMHSANSNTCETRQFAKRWLVKYQVSIVFHSAAVIKFNLPLREALKNNVEGTSQVLELSRRMKKLEVFVHISSAYAQLDKLVVDEVTYPPPAKLDYVYEFLNKHENDAKKMATLIKDFPNTYTFSKALGEALLVERRGRIPLVILRPSIVMPAMSEPVEGWVDSYQGAMALYIAAGKGALRVAPGGNSIVSDLIPVDYVTNMAIVAAYKCAGSNEVEVFHCCSSAVNPVTWKLSSEYFIEEGEKTKFNVYPNPSVSMVKHPTTLVIASCLTEKLPACLQDLVRIAKRQKPRYVRSQSKIETVRNAVGYFMAVSWQFRCARAQALLRALPPADRRLFPADPALIQWRPYLAACQRGAVAHLLQQKNYANGTYRQLDVL